MTTPLSEESVTAVRDLPTAPYAEQSLLGLALVFDSARDLAVALPAGVWTQDAAAVVVDLMRADVEEGIPASAVAVMDRAHASGMPRAQIDAMLAPIRDDVSPLSSAGHFATLIRERAEARRAILQCEAAARRMREAPGDALATFRALVDSAHNYTTTQSSYRPMADAMRDAFVAAEARKRGDMSGCIVTGVPKLDDAPLYGFEPGDLCTIVMVSGHGKTAKLAHLALRAALAGTGVGFVSCEMADVQIGRRMAPLLTGIPFERVRLWDVSDHQVARLSNAERLLRQLPLYIDDRPTPTVRHVVDAARALKRKHPNLGILGIDYMTLVKGEGQTSTEQYNQSVRAIKALAKELGVVIFMLVQPDARTVEKRPDDEQMPRLDDIAWCQEFRNLSDVIICGYRPGKSAQRHLKLVGADLARAIAGIDDRVGRFMFAKSRNSGVAGYSMPWWGEAMAYDGGSWDIFNRWCDAEGVAA